MNSRNKARREKAIKNNEDEFNCAKCEGTGERGVRGHKCRECNGKGKFKVRRDEK